MHTDLNDLGLASYNELIRLKVIENKEIELKNTSLSGQVCMQSFYYCNNVEKITINDEFSMGKVTQLNYFAERCWKLKEFTGQYFEKCIYGSNVFGENWELKKFDCGLPALQQTNNAMSFFSGCPLEEIKFPIDEDGVCIYKSKKQQAIIDGEPQYEYLTLPKLTTGPVMFDRCKLNKPTLLSILNSLRTFTSGSHLLTLGIHIDHKYDPEVNIALKKCQNSYVTPIEEYGASLPEEITINKNWTLTVQWKGTKTENAYPEPNLKSYDIVEGGAYIPDASSWHDIVAPQLEAENIRITRVVDGKAYIERN